MRGGAGRSRVRTSTLSFWVVLSATWEKGGRPAALVGRYILLPIPFSAISRWMILSSLLPEADLAKKNNYFRKRSDTNSVQRVAGYYLWYSRQQQVQMRSISPYCYYLTVVVLVTSICLVFKSCPPFAAPFHNNLWLLNFIANSTCAFPSKWFSYCYWTGWLFHPECSHVPFSLYVDAASVLKNQFWPLHKK